MQKTARELRIPKPVGDYLLNLPHHMAYDGAYYHYKDACTALSNMQKDYETTPTERQQSEALLNEFSEWTERQPAGEYTVREAVIDFLTSKYGKGNG